MSYAPHTNDRRNPEVDPIIQGAFREVDHGGLFEFAIRMPQHFGTWAGGFNQIVYVGTGGYRLARVLKTVAYIVVDEDVDGQPVTEKWFIKDHRAYDISGFTV